MAQPGKPGESLSGLTTVFQYFWPHIRKHRGLMVAAFLAFFAEVGLRLLEPWPLKFVFDHILHAQKGSGRSVQLPTYLAEMDGVTLLTLAALAMVAFTLLRAVAAYQQTISFAKIGNRVIRRVREQLYRHVQYLSLSFHTSNRTGDLVVRMISDVGMLQEVTVTAFMPLAAKSLVVIGMFGLMLWMNWKLALVALGVFPLFWLRTVTLSRRIQEIAKKQRRQEGAMAATAAESMTAIKTIQALSLESVFANSFSAESERNLNQDVKGKRLSASLERSVEVIIAVGSALVLWYGTRLVLSGEITAGDLLVFLAYLKSSYRPVQDFAKYTSRLAKASAAGERVIDLLQRVPEVGDAPTARRAPELAGGVQFDHVTFGYDPNDPVLENISFTVRPGQRIALLGASGSGKSTLAALILRLYQPQSGRVLVDGMDTREFTLESLRGQIGVVLQDNILFAASIRDNIAYGAAQATEEEIIAAAKLANAHEFIMNLPEGYATHVGERGATLSSGQKQRIAIARAAARKASILILDEPTTGLDKRSEQLVLEALEQVQKGRTTFIISHDFRHAVTADVILYLEEGKILESGSHEELLRSGGRYASLYRMQTGGAFDLARDPTPA